MARQRSFRPNYNHLVSAVSVIALMIASLPPVPAHAQFGGGLFGGGQEDGGGAGLLGDALRSPLSPGEPKPQETSPPRPEDQTVEESAPAPMQQSSTTTESEANEALHSILEQLREAQSRNEVPTSPSKLIAAVGRDVEALHSWLRTNVLLVPYRGQLRGAEGVLIDRRGNSADQALLIKAALDAAGRENRLMRGKLDPVQFESLLGRASSVSLDGRPVPRPPGGTRAEEEYLIAHSRLENQPADLLAAMEVLREPPAEMRARERAQALGDLSAHWWVQTNIEGDWTDVDPSAERFGATVGFDGVEAVPEPHEVTFRLRARDLSNRKSTLLDVTRPAHEVAGQQITLAHHPDQEDGEPENWLPVLTLGEERIFGSVIASRRGFLEPREKNLAPFAAPSSGPGQLGSEMESALGGIKDMLQGVGEQRGATSAQREHEPNFDFVQAEWIEIEVTSPGRDPIIARRDLFDLQIENSRRLNQQLREAGWARQLIMKVETAALTERILLERVVPTVEEVIRLSSQQGARTVTPRDLLRSIVTMELETFSFQRWRWNPYGMVTFVDRPNIHAFHLEEPSNEPDGRSMHRRFDVLVNSVGVQPTNRVDPFAARLYQGVTDTIAEALVLRDPDSDENTSALHQRMAIDNSLRTVSQISETVEAAEPATHSYIERAIEDGDVALVLPEFVNPDGQAWWRVDPATGATLGHVGQYGQATTEYLILQKKVTLNDVAWAAGLSLAIYQSACAVAAAICSLAEAAGDAGEAGVDLASEAEQLICDEPQLGPEVSIIPPAAAIDYCVRAAMKMACPAAALLTLLGGADDPQTPRRPRDRTRPGGADGGLGNTNQMSGNQGAGQNTGSLPNPNNRNRGRFNQTPGGPEIPTRFGRPGAGDQSVLNEQFDQVDDAIRNSAQQNGSQSFSLPRHLALDAPWVGRNYSGGSPGRAGQRINNSEGWLRDRSRYWNDFREAFPDDARSLGIPETGRVGSVRVTEDFANKYGWPQSTVGEVLEHHHLNNGPYVVPLPASLHDDLSGAIHRAAELMCE